eukprot:GILI01037744.1.p1 GENE.GILI01037744.1~~GILI01037744.1.p1  ORF type:complete len:156 (+),score=33.01 GILI01037744.1:41-508(+)
MQPGTAAGLAFGLIGFIGTMMICCVLRARRRQRRLMMSNNTQYLNGTAQVQTYTYQPAPTNQPVIYVVGIQQQAYPAQLAYQDQQQEPITPQNQQLNQGLLASGGGGGGGYNSTAAVVDPNSTPSWMNTNSEQGPSPGNAYYYPSKEGSMTEPPQ